MRYLTLNEVIELHDEGIKLHGGSYGIGDKGKLESAVAQPQMTFDDQDLYPTLVEKAAALAFSLSQNHAFIDGNKRVAQAAMETFLDLNGYEIYAEVDEQEQIFLQMASGELSRKNLVKWLNNCIIECDQPA